MKIRYLALVVVLPLALALTGCGVVKGITQLVSGTIESDVKGKVTSKPYLAKSFQSDRDAVVKAVTGVLQAEGYILLNSELSAGLTSQNLPQGEYGIWTKPVKVAKAGKVLSKFGDAESFDLEVLETRVLKVDGKETVYLLYKKGKSYSDEYIETMHPKNIESKFDPPVVLEDKVYYGSIMEKVAAAVK